MHKWFEFDGQPGPRVLLPNAWLIQHVGVEILPVAQRVTALPVQSAAGHTMSGTLCTCTCRYRSPYRLGWMTVPQPRQAEREIDFGEPTEPNLTEKAQGSVRLEFVSSLHLYYCGLARLLRHLSTMLSSAMSRIENSTMAAAMSAIGPAQQ